MHTLSRASLDWALKHARSYGDTDVFPAPFEYEALEFDWDEVGSYLETVDALSWSSRPTRNVLAPKARHGFRIITQLDPLDFLVFAASVYEIAEELEALRIPTSEERVFSYRVNIAPNGQLYDPAVGYIQFLQRAKAKLEADASIAFVATTDISDFYSRIYHHRLENALGAATTQNNNVRVIMNLLRGWNRTETFGIPIGSAPMRLLAESTLVEVDAALLANQVDFIRYNDDFRIFADSYSGAYRAIALLADILYRSRGLTLQQQKTTILDVDTFRRSHLNTLEERAEINLHSKFRDLAAELGLTNFYDPIDYAQLSDEQKKAVDELNLEQLLKDELSTEDPDLSVIRFLLRRLGQLGNDSVVDEILDYVDTIHPVLPVVCEYLSSLQNMDAARRERVGNRLVDLLRGSVVSQMPYHKMWILKMFAESPGWGQDRELLPLYSMEPNDLGKRALILAMRTAGMSHWFQSQWRDIFDFPHWARRAVIAGASCLARDARHHWRRSLVPDLDPLEKAVMKWAVR